MSSHNYTLQFQPEKYWKIQILLYIFGEGGGSSNNTIILKIKEIWKKKHFIFLIHFQEQEGPKKSMVKYIRRGSVLFKQKL